MIKQGFYKCSNCGFHSSYPKNYCMLKHHDVDDNDYCSKHKSVVYQCDVCGRLLTNPIIYGEGDNIHIYCRQCFNKVIK